MSDLISREALLEAVQYSSSINELDIPNVLDLITNAPAITQGEPVAWMIQTQKIDGTLSKPYAMSGKYKYVKDSCDFGEPIPLYTTPPQKQWVGLSDEEIFALCPYIDHDLLEEAFYRGAEAIEAKLKELNT